MAKQSSWTHGHIRKIRNKAGGIKKVVLVKPHNNRINRKPRKK